jgi:hypothetical protein
MDAMDSFTPKAAAQHELLFNEPASDLCFIIPRVRVCDERAESHHKIGH